MQQFHRHGDINNLAPGLVDYLADSYPYDLDDRLVHKDERHTTAKQDKDNRKVFKTVDVKTACIKQPTEGNNTYTMASREEHDTYINNYCINELLIRERSKTSINGCVLPGQFVDMTDDQMLC